MSRLRTALFVACLIALAGFVWVSSVVYRAQRAPESRLSDTAGVAWMAGPPAESLSDAAEGHLLSAIDALNDMSRPPGVRLRAYREHVAAAERLLVGSLRAQPLHARDLARLAAVRWELSPPLDEAAVEQHLRLIRLAGRLAPRMPAVQFELGELLLKMGRRDAAVLYLGRAIELDPNRSTGVVELLEANLFTPPEMLEALPRLPETLVALERPFGEAGLDLEFVRTVEPDLDEATVELLHAYASAQSRRSAHAELRDALVRLDAFSEPRLEAERLLQLSLTLIALGDAGPAVEAARRAADLDRRSARYPQNLGRVLLGAGQADEAVKAFDEALRRLVVRSAGPVERAQVYVEIGRAEQRRNRNDRAYDAYKMALELFPDEPIAGQRLEELRRSAGLQTR